MQIDGEPDAAMTKGEYDRLDRSDPRPPPGPVDRLLQAIRDEPDSSWRDQAACRGMTGLFYPERGSRLGYGPARRLCRGCPVSGPCGVAGEFEVYGMWGGGSPRERKAGRVGSGRVVAGRQYRPEVRVRALELVGLGLSDSAVGVAVGVGSRTVQTWRRAVGVVKDNQGRVE